MPINLTHRKWTNPFKNTNYKLLKMIQEENRNYLIDAGLKDGLTKISDNQFSIYYNDLMPERRIRWTLMHEMGHYFLKHSEASELAEAEADFFAKNILAPPILIQYMNIKDSFELYNTFKLSDEASEYSWKYYNNWLKKRQTELDEIEKEVLNVYTGHGHSIIKDNKNE